eukprot:Rhum_TRINITY_DN1812_c0_g1::Rhum_TRINITY_DN1812_c0_g1_i1::g.5024::m.5024
MFSLCSRMGIFVVSAGMLVLLPLAVQGGVCQDNGCVAVGFECWCYKAGGATGGSRCGYGATYSEEYFSIDPIASKVLPALGKKMYFGLCNGDNMCAVNCGVNQCQGTSGCWGTSRTCKTNQEAWLVSDEGVVRCVDWEPAATTDAPPTDSPPTDAPPTDTPTNAPPTNAPPTNAPPTDAPPTDTPPTNAPPTAAPPTDAPPTDAPPTNTPPTNAPPTPAPPTDEPPTNAPPTSAPPTEAPPTNVPMTPASLKTAVPGSGQTPIPWTDAPTNFATAQPGSSTTPVPQTAQPVTLLTATPGSGDTPVPWTDAPAGSPVPSTASPMTPAPLAPTRAALIFEQEAVRDGYVKTAIDAGAYGGILGFAKRTAYDMGFRGCGFRGQAGETGSAVVDVAQDNKTAVVDPNPATRDGDKVVLDVRFAQCQPDTPEDDNACSDVAKLLVTVAVNVQPALLMANGTLLTDRLVRGLQEALRAGQTAPHLTPPTFLPHPESPEYTLLSSVASSASPLVPFLSDARRRLGDASVVAAALRPLNEERQAGTSEYRFMDPLVMRRGPALHAEVSMTIGGVTRWELQAKKETALVAALEDSTRENVVSIVILNQTAAGVLVKTTFRRGTVLPSEESTITQSGYPEVLRQALVAARTSGQLSGRGFAVSDLTVAAAPLPLLFASSLVFAERVSVVKGKLPQLIPTLASILVVSTTDINGVTVAEARSPSGELCGTTLAFTLRLPGTAPQCQTVPSATQAAMRRAFPNGQSFSKLGLTESSQCGRVSVVAKGAANPMTVTLGTELLKESMKGQEEVFRALVAGTLGVSPDSILGLVIGDRTPPSLARGEVSLIVNMPVPHTPDSVARLLTSNATADAFSAAGIPLSQPPFDRKSVGVQDTPAADLPALKYCRAMAGKTGAGCPPSITAASPLPDAFYNASGAPTPAPSDDEATTMLFLIIGIVGFVVLLAFLLFLWKVREASKEPKYEQLERQHFREFDEVSLGVPAGVAYSAPPPRTYQQAYEPPAAADDGASDVSDAIGTFGAGHSTKQGVMPADAYEQGSYDVGKSAGRGMVGPSMSCLSYTNMSNPLGKGRGVLMPSSTNTSPNTLTPTLFY